MVISLAASLKSAMKPDRSGVIEQGFSDNNGGRDAKQRIAFTNVGMRIWYGSNLDADWLDRIAHHNTTTILGPFWRDILDLDVNRLRN
jgi:hypothetical protein